MEEWIVRSCKARGRAPLWRDLRGPILDSLGAERSSGDRVAWRLGRVLSSDSRITSAFLLSSSLTTSSTSHQHMMLLKAILYFACFCLLDLGVLAAPAVETSLQTRGSIGAPTGHGIVPLQRPARCERDNVYCLSVQASRGLIGVWGGREGVLSWTETDSRGQWRTYGEQQQT